MHAKKTRDRKKMFLQASEQIISEMESQVDVLRNYLLSLKILSLKEVEDCHERDIQSRRELLTLKVKKHPTLQKHCMQLIAHPSIQQASQNDEDLLDNGEEDDPTDDRNACSGVRDKLFRRDSSCTEEDEFDDDIGSDRYGDDENDGNSISGSDDNEKWSGSNDGSSGGSNDGGSSGSGSSSRRSDGSVSGETTADGSNSSGSCTDEKLSRGGSTHDSADFESGSGGDSPMQQHENGYCRGSSPANAEDDSGEHAKTACHGHEDEDMNCADSLYTHGHARRYTATTTVEAPSGSLEDIPEQVAYGRQYAVEKQLTRQLPYERQQFGQW